MPGKFDFAFVQTQNLKLKFFPVNQAIVTFTVTGDDDPLTLQLMRDACSAEFVKTQKKVNEFIKARNGEISRLSFNDRRAKKHEKLFESGNQTIQKFLDEFKQAANGELEAFARKQSVKQQKIANAPTTGSFLVKWGISVAWTLYQGGKGLFDVFGGEGPVKIFDGIKGFMEALNDLMGLLEKLRDLFADEKTVNLKVRAALKNLASKKSFTEGDVKVLEDLVHLYEAKVLAMEVASKSLSAKIAHAVTVIPRNGIKPEAQKEAETELHNLLTGLVKLQTNLKPVEKQLLKYRAYLGAAKQQAKKEPSSWLSWAAGKAYDLKEAIFAGWESKFDEAAKELAEKGVDALIKRFAVPENVVVSV
ncbi:MAG: hypothetical protein JST11_15410 [Acidobacteria bacterium]|nr:hypothetical protein [Acidobacteriota bacterium]